jgi:3-oxoadipate enol-lactonase
MPIATNSGVDLYYEIDGAGESGGGVGASTGGHTRGGQPVAFVNPAGYGAWVWSWQHSGLTGPLETLVWDLRGTGRSDVPDGPYDVSMLTADFEAVLAAAGTDAVHVVGAGLGGMVAVEHARRYDRAATLTLFGTAPSGDAVDREALSGLFAPRDDQTALRASLVDAFAADLDAHPEVIERIGEWRARGDADRAGFEAQIAAMTDYEADALYKVTTPARVFHGESDVVVPPDAGRDLAADLPRGGFTAVDGGHLCFIEASAAITDELVDRFADV